MKARFENVNVIEVLKKIMMHNTEHYQSDFDYDIEKLQKAAEDSCGSRCFLWLSRSCGTWCFEERDVYIRNTQAFNTWGYYNHSNDNVKAFAVEIEALQGKAVMGHVYELDYKAHIEDVRKNCFNAKEVEVVFKHPGSSNGYVRCFDIDEYNNNWYSIGQRYGEAESLNYKVSDEMRLQDILCQAKQRRIINTEAGHLDEYIEQMVKERLHAYGYIQDNMIFTTPGNAFDALGHNITVYMLSRYNTKESVICNEEITHHVTHKGIFGMRPDDKRLLEYLMAPPENRKELFNRAELLQVYTLALAAGQSGKLDKSTMEEVEAIVNKLDRVLTSLPETAEKARELDEEMEV